MKSIFQFIHRKFALLSCLLCVSLFFLSGWAPAAIALFLCATMAQVPVPGEARAGPNIPALNNFFEQSVNQFVEPIYNWIWRVNPFISIIPRAEFTPMDGLVPMVVTTTSGLPTLYPDDAGSGWNNLAISDGTNSSCSNTPTEIDDGSISRNYQLEANSWTSRSICLTDLQFDWQAEQMVANLQKNLMQYITVVWSDWYRIKSIGASGTKISTLTGDAIFSSNDSNQNFSGLAGNLPTQVLSWNQLAPLYDQLMQLGAEVNAVGYSEGQPLLSLICGPGLKKHLWQDDTQVRDTVNWGDAFQNFTARGINTSINGFIPNMDLYPIRYAADGVTKIYPTINVAASKGTKNIPNPAYKSLSKYGAAGGLAVYEVFYIFPNDVWEARVRPIGITNYGMAGFNPINYVGELAWYNIRDNVNNPDGTNGYYKMQIQAAAKPVRPEIGIAGLTQVLD